MSVHLHSLIYKTKIKPALPILQGSGSYALVCKELLGVAVQNPKSRSHLTIFWFGRSRLELRNHAAFLRNSPGSSNAGGGPWATPSTDFDLVVPRPFLEERVGF